MKPEDRCRIVTNGVTYRVQIKTFLGWFYAYIDDHTRRLEIAEGRMQELIEKERETNGPWCPIEEKA